jgi:UDP-N-acetylmuramoyl-L-alanyl-D-glutamate--2,6-diaminopimelate ligase
MVNEKEYKATHTTPDSININHYLNEMIESGVEYCFMEVSSHGIHQREQKDCICGWSFLICLMII